MKFKWAYYLEESSLTLGGEDACTDTLSLRRVWYTWPKGYCILHPRTVLRGEVPRRRGTETYALNLTCGSRGGGKWNGLDAISVAIRSSAWFATGAGAKFFVRCPVGITTCKVGTEYPYNSMNFPSKNLPKGVQHESMVYSSGVGGSYRLHAS